MAEDSVRAGALRDRFAFGVCLMIMLLHVVDGLDMQLLGVTVNALTRDWNLPLHSFSVAMAAGHAGAAVGAIIGGYLGDRLGRKPVIIGGVLLFALASFATALVVAPSQLALLRFVAGIGLGGCLPPALTLLTESMPPRYRGLSISIVMLCFPLGIALSGFLAMVLIPQSGWQTMFLAGGAIAMAFAVILLCCLAGSRRGSAQSETIDRGAMRQLLLGEERGKMLPLIGTFFCCYFTTNMMLSWLPALMAHSGAAPQLASGAISVWSLGGMSGVFAAGLVMMKWGIRRGARIYLSGGILALVTLAAVTAKGHAVSAALPYLALLASGGFMLTGTIATIFAYSTDIFASALRSSAIGLVATAGRLGAIAGSAAGASILEAGGAAGVFGVAALMFGSALLLYTVTFAALRRPATAS